MSRRFFTWSDLEVVRMSRKDEEFSNLKSPSDFIKNGIRLDIGCYPDGSVSIFRHFAPPEGCRYRRS